VDPRPFDPDLYEPLDPAEATQHELQLSVENTMRWRYVQDADDPTKVHAESNSRIITWSDGSRSLLVGDELLELVSATTAKHQYLVSIHHEDNMIVPEKSLQHKLLVQPYSTANKSHQKMASLLASKFRRTHKTKMVHLERDPEKVRAEQLKVEMERVKAQKKLEAKKKAIEAKYSGHRDEDEDDEALDSYHLDDQQRRERMDEDDLDDFVVDDEEVEHYNEEDELEEKRRMERLMASRRDTSGAKVSRLRDHDGDDPMNGAHSEDPDEEEEEGPISQRHLRPSNGDDGNDESSTAGPRLTSRRSKNRAVLSDEEEEI
jgi:RNA polymerase-associated protein LEO1